MSYNKIIEELIEENEKLKEQVDNLRQDLQNRCDRCIELNDEKRYWLDNFKRLRDDKIKLLDENEEHKQRISKLVSENTNLQNDLFSEQLLQDETDEYINRLKQELFNAYLEIESDNVNIQLSHYHIKKLLKIIDEHTLINPYTN